MADRTVSEASIVPAPSTAEAAAIVAALEHFRRATATAAAAPSAPAPEGWAREALLEGVARAPGGDGAHPWINT